MNRPRNTMPDFTYEALATTGQRSQGTLTAGSEREVQAMLDSRGLFPLRIQAAAGGVMTMVPSVLVWTAQPRERRSASLRRARWSGLWRRRG